MEMKVTTLDGKAAGSVTLTDEIFGLEPRKDLIQRCIVWQLAKRRAGTHKVKSRAEIRRTGKKMSSRRAPAVPVTVRRASTCSAAAAVRSVRSARSHAIDLPKKVRALALRHALSAKAKDGGIIVLEAATVKDGKTKALRTHFGSSGSLTR